METGTKHQGAETMDHGDEVAVENEGIFFAGWNLRDEEGQGVVEDEVHPRENGTFEEWKHRIEGTSFEKKDYY